MSECSSENFVLEVEVFIFGRGGRITLVRHVLSAIPIHLLSAAVMPKAVFRVIERVCSNFLWGSLEEGLKFY